MSRYPYTRKTLELLRNEGFKCVVVEKWCPFSRHRIDMFGFIDILAFKENMVVGVQSSSAAGRAMRRRKILSLQDTREWISFGFKIELITWAKQKIVKGGTAFKYVPTRESFSRENFITSEGTISL